jgi:FkbM family methyltransferase
VLEASKYKYRLHEPGGVRRLLGLAPRHGFTRLQKNRLRLMQTHGVDTVLDIGANTGQFAIELRELGFAGNIVSFEPLADAYQELARHAAFDKRWKTVNLAIGDCDHTTEINVSQNSQSSSILGILPETLEAAPTARYVGTQRVEVRTLDGIIDRYLARQDRPYLKIDTQGYERQVLDGARQALADRIVGVQVECSLVALYESEARFEEILALMKQEGFALLSIEPEFSNDTTGQLLQADLIFYRTKSLAA